MYEGKVGAYPKGAPFSFSPLGNALFLLANIRIGWKSLSGTNTLTYFEHLQITDGKSFITLAPG
jgi:hypothetical protein